MNEGLSTSRVIFARVGLLTYYAGSQPWDERPVGAGSHNQENLGHERFNFADIDGRLYGYFQPSAGGYRLNLERVQPGAVDRAENILVVFIADRTVVGWYTAARIHAVPPELSADLAARREGCEYYCDAPAKRCVLLPTAARKCQVPVRRNGMGQSNVTYSLDDRGRPKDAAWISEVLRFIRSYKGPNLLTDQLGEADAQLDEAIQSTLAAARGQRYDSDPAARKVIEDYAVRIAKVYFAGSGYRVVQRGKPFDLDCARGKKRIFVEVKGSQAPCEEVLLTPNEVEFARDHRSAMALFVVDSIALDGKDGEFMARGGTPRLYYPWSLERKSLKPVAFVHRLPQGGKTLAGVMEG
jgi:hypothetical protein